MVQMVSNGLNVHVYWALILNVHCVCICVFVHSTGRLERERLPKIMSSEDTIIFHKGETLNLNCRYVTHKAVSMPSNEMHQIHIVSIKCNM